MRFFRYSLAFLGAPATIAFFAAALILLVGGWQIIRMHEASLADAEQGARILSRSLAQHAARTLEAVDLLLSDTVERIETDADDSQLAPFLERWAARAAQVRGIAVTNTAGQSIAEAGSPRIPPNSGDHEYFTWHRDHADRELHVGDTMSRDQGSPAIALSRRINRSDGSFGGVVVAWLAPEYLQAFYQTVHLGPEGSVALFGFTGQVVARYPAVSNGTDGTRVPASLDMRLFAPTSGVYRLRSRFDGVERIFAFEHIKGFPLVVTAGVAIGDALAEWRREASIEAAVLAIAAVVLAMLGYGLEVHRRRTHALESVARELNRQYRLLAENSGDLIALKPSFSASHDYVSQSCNTIVGWEPAELAALPTKDYIHPDDLDRVAKDFAGLTPEHPRVTSLHRVRHKAGHFVWLEAVFQLATSGATRQSIIVAARDVTARKKAEEALKDSEARYRALSDATSDVITRLDLDLVSQYVSPACRTVFGHEASEMVGRHLVDSVHPDEKSEVLGLAQGLAAGDVEGDRAAATYRASHKLGHWVWVEAAMTLLRDSQTRLPDSVICSVRDVTARQRAARELERAKRVAEQAAAAKAEFLADMSHELRTPLTGLLGVHDLLHSDPTLTDAQRRLVGLASASGRSLLNIVNDVLDLSKMGAGQLAIERVPFELASLLAYCRDLAAESLKGKPVRIETIYEADEDGWYIGDPTRLKQILLNLLGNAVKFTERGMIVVEATYSTAETALRFVVTDTGIGIPADKMPKLFQRFSQADASTTRQYGGTGLGLAISKQLVELMQGRIGVEALEQGSRFWFEVPAQRCHGTTEAALPASLPEARRISRRILLAEDSVVNQEIIAAMLASRDHVVTVVSDGAAAVAATRQGSGFDLILMDAQMPGMGGLAATDAIRRIEYLEARSRTPIIGLTAKIRPEDIARGLAAGMDAHLTKPIDWPQLFAEIDRVVRPPGGGPGTTTPRLDRLGGVLNSEALATLDRIIGRERLNEMLAAFALEVERRLDALDAADVARLSAEVHSLTSIAGQLGFSELSELCASIEDEARQGGGLQRIRELRSAATRALSAARATPFARAA